MTTRWVQAHQSAFVEHRLRELWAAWPCCYSRCIGGRVQVCKLILSESVFNRMIRIGLGKKPGWNRRNRVEIEQNFLGIVIFNPINILTCARSGSNRMHSAPATMTFNPILKIYQMPIGWISRIGLNILYCRGYFVENCGPSLSPCLCGGGREELPSVILK